MKKLLLSFYFLTIPLLIFAQIEKPIGINLNRVTDYSPEIVFVDAFKQARNWISHNEAPGGPWSTGVEVDYDENGYPLQIPFDNGVDSPQRVRTLMLWTLPEEGFPAGRARLIVKGKGRVRLLNSASGTYETPLDTYVDISTGSGIQLIIEESDINDHINDIKFILPGYGETYQEKTFTDEFLAFLDDFQLIRFMDWLQTNNSKVETWEDRTSKDRYSQSGGSGVAWEYIIELANTTKQDMWICIPHLADDDYITKTAELIHNTLDANINVYIEYSNEVWNSGFKQSNASWDLGEAAGLGTYHAGWKWTSKRSADIFYLFEQVFTNHDRLVKLIPSQSAYAGRSDHLMEYFEDPLYNPHGIKANALAIAPYFSTKANELAETITVEEIVELMDESLPKTFEDIQENLEVANKYNVELIAYEGGQHLAGSNIETIENEVLTEKFKAVNHHPDFQETYCKYLNYWYENVGEIFTHFSSHSKYGKHGSWGVKEHMNDFDNPKYLALQNCVFKDNNPEEIDPNADEDNDGVLDTLDKCPNTPIGITVNTNGCEIFSLPATNFTIQTIDESCMNSNNGKITISAQKTLNYNATLTLNSLNINKNFTDNIEFRDLDSGEYEICITVNDVTSYKQCNTVIISEPEVLSVESRINISQKTITLNLKGGELYTIELNNNVYKTSDKEITLPLSSYKINNVFVKTDKNCQGHYKDAINLHPKTLIYPNPVKGDYLQVHLKELQNEQIVEMLLITLDGKIILKDNFKTSEGYLTIDVSSVNEGLYLLKLKIENQIQTYKILRN